MLWRTTNAVSRRGGWEARHHTGGGSREAKAQLGGRRECWGSRWRSPHAVTTPTAATRAATTAAERSSAAPARSASSFPTPSPRCAGSRADRPALEAAFKEAGVEYDIQNAEGDAEKMTTDRRQHDRRRRHRPRDRQPRLRVGCRDRGEGGLAGRQDHRLRPPHARWLGGLLRLLRQHQGRRAPGPGPRRLPRRQGRQHHLPQRLAHRQQRDAVRGRCARGPRPDQQLQDRRRAGRPRLGQRAGRRRSSSSSTPQPTARSTASSPPTTASAARSSPSSRRTARPARSRSPVRTRPSRVCRTSSPAPSA